MKSDEPDPTVVVTRSSARCCYRNEVRAGRNLGCGQQNHKCPGNEDRAYEQENGVGPPCWRPEPETSSEDGDRGTKIENGCKTDGGYKTQADGDGSEQKKKSGPSYGRENQAAKASDQARPVTENEAEADPR
jgi:hypothetical protein